MTKFFISHLQRYKRFKDYFQLYILSHFLLLMAAFSTNNTRKNSRPSPSHPLLVTTEQHLIRVIESFQGTRPSSHISLIHQFSCLKTLYESLGDVLHMQVYQKDLAFDKSGDVKGAELEEIHEGSIMLLDMCGVIKDCYSQVKDEVKEIESSMRRKGVEYDIGGYITSKKMLHKMVSKCFTEMNKIKKHYGNMLQKDDSASRDCFLHLLRKVQQVTFEMLQTSLCFISHTKADRSKILSDWGLLTKFFKAKKVSCEEETEGNLLEKIDFGLEQLMHHEKSSNSTMKIQNVLKNMKLLESSIEELEKELESVFRLLLRNRVYLLNNVNSYF